MSTPVRSRLPFALLAGLTLVALGLPVAAAPAGFSAEEIKAIAPLLGRHQVVALTTSEAPGKPGSMALAVRVEASRENAFKVFEQPENFSWLSSLFRENKVLEEGGGTKAFSWASRHKLFTFTGTNTIAYYPPRRVDVKVANSTLGTGGFRFDFHEEAPDRTILVLSGQIDIQTSDWLIRFLLGGNPAMREAMNLAVGIVAVKGAKQMAEELQAGKPHRKHRTSGPAGSNLRPVTVTELAALKALLLRGSVVLIDTNRGGRLGQATVIEAIAAPADTIRSLLSAPETWPKLVRAMTAVDVAQRTPTGVDFSWRLGFSVFSLGSNNRLAIRPDGVRIDALDGELANARWLWQIVPLDAGHAVVAYHGFAELSRAGYVLEASLKREAFLEHGIMAGANLVMLRAIRRGAEAR